VILHAALRRNTDRFIGMKESRQALLRKAVSLVGRDALASGLKVPMSVLDAWLSGNGTMPDGKLGALIHVMDEISNPPRQ
jgi:hypothetical protein